jgi:prephenate dehydrogenase
MGKEEGEMIHRIGIIGLGSMGASFAGRNKREMLTG